MNDPREVLAEVKELALRASSDDPDCRRLIDHSIGLVAALTAVLDTHHSTEFDWLGQHLSICDECSEAGGVEPGLFVDYPCPTVHKITKALQS